MRIEKFPATFGVGPVDPQYLQEAAFWDSVGIRLYDLTTRRDLLAPRMLPAVRVILETLKAEEKRLDSNPKTTS
ncbi:hypothetical protein TURU_086100 [Turdus rufiventris]|nr:hypothetical protein TURU_086100 [Turdus rufiventris]